MQRSSKYSKINIHTDLSSVSESELAYVRNQHPVDRIRETVQLILRIYSSDKKKPKNNRIYFDKE